MYLAGSIEESGKIPSVNIDYEQAAYEALHLIEKGHKRIAIVFGPLYEPRSIREKKMAGYKQALSEAGIEYNEEFMVEGDYTYDSGIEAFEKFLEFR